MSGPEVRACVVGYRSGERALAALRSALSEGAEAVFVDNAPESGDAELVRRELPEVVVGCPRRNLGFAAGSNLAAEGAETEFLLFLNPDARLEPAALATLCRALDEDPGAGIAGPGLTGADCRPQPSVRTDPTARAVLHQYTAWKFPMIFRRAYRRYRGPPQAPGAAEVLMGSVLLVRTDVFRALGGFDPRYFMYYEEADLCRRVRAAGHRVLFVPAATAIHEGGASASRAGAGLAAIRIVSAQRYLQRFLPRGRWILFRAAFVPAFPLRAVYDLFRDLVYTAAYACWPPKHAKVGRKAREALSSLRLLTADLFRVWAG